jgi:hypothetical protein
MNALLNDYRMLWKAAVVQRNWRSLRSTLWLIAVVVPLVFFGFIYFRHDWMLAATASAILASAIMLIVTLMIFVAAAALMNTPANAKLLPRMRRRLIEMTVAGWVGIAVVGCLFLQSWAVGVLVGMWAVTMSMGRGGSRIGSMLSILPAMWGVIQHYIPERVLAFLMTPQAVALELPLLLALMMWAIWVIYPNAGDRHFAQRAQQADKINQLDRFRKTTAIANASNRESRLYRFFLRRDCERRNRQALLMHVLGPQGHWLNYWRLPVVALGVGALLKVLAIFWNDADSLTTMSTLAIFMIGMLNIMAIASAAALMLRVQETRAEQSLLRLAPASASTARALNRQLASGMARNVFGAWIAVSAAVMGLTAMSGGSPRALLVAACTCSITLVPSIAYVLRDYARQSVAPSDGMIGWFVFGGAVAGGITYVLADVYGQFAWPLVALAFNLVACAWTVARWKTMLAAPAAFPVGHAAP